MIYGCVLLRSWWAARLWRDLILLPLPLLSINGDSDVSSRVVFRFNYRIYSVRISRATALPCDECWAELSLF